MGLCSNFASSKFGELYNKEPLSKTIDNRNFIPVIIAANYLM